MTEIGTPGIFRWVNGRVVFVPARRPEIGEACLLYPVNGDYLAIPLARPGVGDPVIIEPVGGRYVAVPFVAGAPYVPPNAYAESVAAILAYLGSGAYEYVAPPPTGWAVLSFADVDPPRAIEAITATALLVATGGVRGETSMHRSDDSGATWTNTGVCTVDDGSGNTIQLYDICANAAGDGGFIISGQVCQAPGYDGIWRYNPATGKYILKYIIPESVIRGNLYRIAGGYYLNCCNEGSGYFSTDGDTWAPLAESPSSVYAPFVAGSALLVSLGAHNAVYRSADGGSTWGEAYPHAYVNFGAWDNGTVMGYGASLSERIASSDAGATWSSSTIDTHPIVDMLHATSGAGYVVAVNSSGSVNNPNTWALESYDYGQTWAPIDRQPNVVLWDQLAFPGQARVTLPSGVICIPLYDPAARVMYVWRGAP